MYFDISDNPLENLALQLYRKMPRLRDIFLEKLRIENNYKIYGDLFGTFGCEDWRHVSLARNLISKLDPSSILYSVKGGIDYSHNPLKSIPMFSQSSSSMRYLHFDNCSIKNIASMAFQYMDSLTYVSLKGNDIEYFPQMGPSGIQYDLRNNPIACSCHLRWLHGHPARRSYLFTNCMDPMTGSVEVFDLLPPDRLLCQQELHCAQGCVCFGMNTSTVSIVNCSSRSLITIPFSLSPEADVIYLDHNLFSKPHFPSDVVKMAASQLFLQYSAINFLEQDFLQHFLC